MNVGSAAVVSNSKGLGFVIHHMESEQAFALVPSGQGASPSSHCNIQSRNILATKTIVSAMRIMHACA